MNFEKAVGKALKVETAVLTLSRLAISPHCGIVQKDLLVQDIPLDSKTSITIELENFSAWYPKPEDICAFHAQLHRSAASSTPHNIAIESKIHPECAIAANLMGGPSIDINIVPCAACSKVNCFSCHLWLKAFNARSATNVAFAGTHGGLKTGWLPPTLGPAFHEPVLRDIREKLQDRFEASQYAKIAESNSLEEFQSDEEADILRVQQGKLHITRC
jgi:hypothetical protein